MIYHCTYHMIIVYLSIYSFVIPHIHLCDNIYILIGMGNFQWRCRILKILTSEMFVEDRILNWADGE